MFVELSLLKERILLITVARIDEKVKVNVIPARVKEAEDQALTTARQPLRMSRGVGCGTWQASCQLCQLPPGTSQHLGGGEGRNGRGSKGRTLENENKATALET